MESYIGYQMSTSLLDLWVLVPELRIDHCGDFFSILQFVDFTVVVCEFILYVIQFIVTSQTLYVDTEVEQWIVLLRMTYVSATATTLSRRPLRSLIWQQKAFQILSQVCSICPANNQRGSTFGTTDISEFRNFEY